MAAKTGFISKSGYCLATLLRLPQSDQQVAVVVLGARSNAGRFLETENLFNWFAAKASAIFATATAARSADASGLNARLLIVRARVTSWALVPLLSSRHT